MYQYNLKNGRIDTFFLYYSNIKNNAATLQTFLAYPLNANGFQL